MNKIPFPTDPVAYTPKQRRDVNLFPMEFLPNITYRRSAWTSEMALRIDAQQELVWVESGIRYFPTAGDIAATDWEQQVTS